MRVPNSLGKQPSLTPSGAAPSVISMIGNMSNRKGMGYDDHEGNNFKQMSSSIPHIDPIRKPRKQFVKGTKGPEKGY